MSSIGCEEFQRDCDELHAVLSRIRAHSYESLTPAELVDVLQEYAFIIGRLDALTYELRSPFVRLPGRRT